MTTTYRKFDPLLFEVIRNDLGAINEEMGIAIANTGRSVMVRIGDCATVLMDSEGQFIGDNAAVFQVGIFMTVTGHMLKKYGGQLRPGDVILVNDPYAGIGHMPDVCIITPLFWRERIVGYAATYSHHTDIGGRFPGGFTTFCRESYEEGLRIPLVKLYDQGRRNEALVEMIAANVRGPEEWFGDVDAKIAGCRKAEEQLGLLLDRHGPEAYRATCQFLQQHSEKSVREAIRSIPQGTFEIEDFFEEDGLGSNTERLPIRIALRVDGDSLTVDLTGTAKQAAGAINVPVGMTKGGIYGPVRAITEPGTIINSGFVKPIKVVVPEGTLFNPIFPAAVGGRAALFLRLQDIMCRCLAKALPTRVGIPGEGGDLIHFSGLDADGRHQSFMDSVQGGWGARPRRDGIDACTPVFHGGGGSTPVEMLEREHPEVVVEGFGLIPDSEGAGQFRGSLGTYRQWRFRTPGKVMIRTNRVTRPSEGMAGGLAGALPVNVLLSEGNRTPLAPVMHQIVEIKAGDRLRHVTAGTGGYGNPIEREPELVREDVISGKISTTAAERRYGVALNPESMTVNAAATQAIRRNAVTKEPS